MRRYGNGSFDSKPTTYAEDKEKKQNRAKSDIRDLLGMIRGSSLKKEDKIELLRECSDMIYSEILITK